MVTAATYRLLDTVADSFNPLLALFAIAAPLVRKPRRLRSTLAYYLSAGTAIAFVYLIRFVDQRQQIWSSFGLDYSTHSAFAASLVVSIASFLRRALLALVTCLILYFCLELVMRYHGILDIVSSALLAALIAVLMTSAHRAFSSDDSGSPS